MKPGMVQTWILDASPLILLHKIDFLKTISEFARTWLIPGIVVQEIEEKNPIDSYLRELSLSLKGTLGLIVWAKKQGLIDKLKPHFDNLINAGIRIERNIINELLKAANE
jgi:predicted nucleic acid-binding protein